MARITLVLRKINDEWVWFEKDKAPPPDASNAPHVIRDSLGGLSGLRNHADGKIYDSKRAYEKAVARAGCVIVGNEQQTRRETPMPSPGPDIKAAIEQLRSRS